LTLMVGWQEGHLGLKKNRSTNPRGFLLEQLEVEDPRLTRLHLRRSGR